MSGGEKERIAKAAIRLKVDEGYIRAFLKAREGTQEYANAKRLLFQKAGMTEAEFDAMFKNLGF